jgi:hypothetical protein
MHFVNSVLSQSGAGDETADGAKGIMRVWKISIRASDATGHAVVVFHSLAGGRAKARQMRHNRPLRSDGGRDVAAPAEVDPAASHIIAVSRRSVRKAIAAMQASLVTDKSPALLAVEVMEDGTVNRLGETRASGNAASEALADIVSGASLKASSAHAAGRHSPPLGAWIERLGGHIHWVGPESFFQANTAVAELLVREVADHLPSKLDLLVDAHAGVGTFALQFAGRARRVMAYEPEGTSVESGEWSARAAGITNVEFRKGRAEDLLSRLPPDDHPSAILLDPPRAGCHPSLLAEIARRRIPLVVYISCDPSTLARDIKFLSSSHHLTSARVIDMFPQTYHIETIAVLAHVE